MSILWFSFDRLRVIGLGSNRPPVILIDQDLRVGASNENTCVS